MEFNLKTRKNIIIKKAAKYHHQRKKRKGEIINCAVELIRYNRKYTGWLLRQCGKKLALKHQGEQIILVGKIIKQRKVRAKRGSNFTDCSDLADIMHGLDK